jgi:peptidoglycan/LPS O-acetylase OafA/YrhL
VRCPVPAIHFLIHIPIGAISQSAFSKFHTGISAQFRINAVAYALTAGTMFIAAWLKKLCRKLAKSKAVYSFALLIALSFFLSEKQRSLFPPEQPMYRNMSQQP